MEPPAAAAVPQGDDELPSAWALLLQHDALRADCAVVCSLRCTSRAAAAAAVAAARGQLVVRLPDGPPRGATAADRARAFARFDSCVRWLRRHAADLPAELLDNEGSEAEEWPAQRLYALAAALQAAAAAAPGGRLGFLRAALLEVMPGDAAGLLRVLPPKKLRRLDLFLRPGSWSAAAVGGEEEERRAANKARRALGKLTGLRSLRLVGWHADAFVPALTALQALTSLAVRGLGCDAVVGPGLAASLRGELLLSARFGAQGFPVPLHLGNLTGVTSLRLVRMPVPLGDDDSALPPRLEALAADDCSEMDEEGGCAADLLRPLAGTLRTLELNDTRLAADELLAATSGLSRLRELRLGYGAALPSLGVSAALQAAPAWPRLPLVDLSVDDDVHAMPPDALMRGLARAGAALTRLSLCLKDDNALMLFFAPDRGWDDAEAAAALRQLPSLRTLLLSGGCWAAAHAVLDAVAPAHLPALRELALTRSTPIRSEGAAALARATQLTKLDVSGTSFPVAAIKGLLLEPPASSLRELTAWRTQRVDDASARELEALAAGRGVRLTLVAK